MVKAQNHIHLGTTLSGDPEYAPVIKWKVRADSWIPTPEIIGSHRVTLTGRLRVHRIKRNGDVFHLMNRKYTIVCRDYDGINKQDRFDLLVGLQGERVYVVDSIHPDDGLDHSAHVQVMYLNIISDVASINPQLDPLYVSIELIDDPDYEF